MGVTDKILLGGHISTAGGISKSPSRAAEFNFGTMQIFSKNQMQWKAKPLPDSEVTGFVSEVERVKLRKMMVHASYLLNMGSSDPEMIKKVGDGLQLEVERANLLKIDYLVIHPGSKGTNSEEIAIKNIAEHINKSIEKSSFTKVLLETAAGQGTNLGHTFEQLASMLDIIERKKYVGICFDTCHVFAAGYDIKTAEGYAETMDKFDSQIGISRLLGFHLNDSKKGMGSRLDRHEQIGDGLLGSDGISNFVNDKRFRDVPMVFETPKGEEGYAQDIAVLETVMR